MSYHPKRIELAKLYLDLSWSCVFSVTKTFGGSYVKEMDEMEKSLVPMVLCGRGSVTLCVLGNSLKFTVL